MMCDVCDGAGDIDCYTCLREGLIDNETCPDCDGEGITECIECDGTGEIEGE